MSIVPQSKSVWRPDWLGPRPGLYRPKCWAAASADIAVRELRLLLILPLVLREPARLNEAAAALMQAKEDWLPIPDLSDHAALRPMEASLAAEEQAARYAEFVYFHDFVQQILFKGNATAPEEPVRLFRHMQVKNVSVTRSETDWATKKLIETEYNGTVERALLYLFGSGSAAFVTELRFPPGCFVSPEHGPPRILSLADVQWLTDFVRRTYPPYFIVGKEGDHAGGVPTRFIWRNDRGEPAFPDAPAIDLKEAYNFTFCDATPRAAPMSAHWRNILSPLTIAGYGKGSDTGQPEWRQVVDERIPLMSYVSLTGASAIWSQKAGANASAVNRLRELPANQADLHMVNRGDWVRLCCADPPGTDPLPYNPEFLANFEAEACYDRFFPSDATDSSSRFMFTGYHMNMTGAGPFFDTLMREHFRRHYFQMGLVVNMELASVLAISSRITEATKIYVQHRSGPPDQKRAAAARFRKDMAQIERDFLELTHLYMFRGLSNQIQPTELFVMWRRQLNLDAIYDDLKVELDAAMKVVQTDDDAERSQRSMHLSETANALALLAAFGVVAGIVTGLLSINFLLTTQLAGEWIGAALDVVFKGKSGDGLTVAGHFAVFFAVIGVSCLFGGRMLSFVVPELKGGQRGGAVDAESADRLVTPQLSKFHRILWWTGVSTLFLAVVSVILVFVGNAISRPHVVSDPHSEERAIKTQPLASEATPPPEGNGLRPQSSKAE